jgi:hypothetical protein
MIFIIGILIGIAIGCCITAIVMAIIKDHFRVNEPKESHTHFDKKHVNDTTDHDAPASISG